MPNIRGKLSKMANRHTKIDFWTLYRLQITSKLYQNAQLNSLSDSDQKTRKWIFWDFGTSWHQIDDLKFDGFSSKSTFFEVSFVAKWRFENRKITIFYKKRCRCVYYHPNYPPRQKKVVRESTSRFWRGWLVKRFEKKWIWRREWGLKIDGF